MYFLCLKAERNLMLKDFKSPSLALSWFISLSAMDCSSFSSFSSSQYFTAMSPNIYRKVMTRGQPICSCSIIDAMVHLLPPFLAFGLNRDAHAGVSGSRYIADNTALWRPVRMMLQRPATHTIFSSETFLLLPRYWTYSARCVSLRQNTLYRCCDTTKSTRTAQRSYSLGWAVSANVLLKIKIIFEGLC